MGEAAVLAPPPARPDPGLYYLKRFERRPMTKLAQEAVDRLLEEHGGPKAIIARGIERFGDRGEERLGPRAID